MIIRKFASADKELWKVLYENNPSLSPYQSPDFMAEYLKTVLYINNQIAAYLSGFINSDESRIIVPRLSMNNDFGFYDPGVVLIFETAKYLCQTRPHTELDLSRGNEKYKYVMGGKTHYNYNFVI